MNDKQSRPAVYELGLAILGFVIGAVLGGAMFLVVHNGLHGGLRSYGFVHPLQEPFFYLPFILSGGVFGAALASWRRLGRMNDFLDQGSRP